MSDNQFDVFQTMTITPRTFPQMDLLDVQGNRVDVNQLAKNYHIMLITLKNATCPVCPQLLKILNMHGLDSECHSYTDPFTLQQYEIDSTRKKFFRLLLKYDTYFVILCPGTNVQVRDVQEKAPFSDYPFISTEGGAIELAKTLKVHVSDQELMPAILEVSSETLSVSSVYIGRGPGQYFHRYLLKRLIDKRCRLELSGIALLREAHETMNQLKRRAVKCREGKMASNWINLKGLQQQTPSPRSSVQTTTTTTTTNSLSSEPSTKTILIDALPSELLEMVFYFLSNDIPSMVKASGTCRLFYITVCNVLGKSIRDQMSIILPALPQTDSGQVIWDETELSDEGLNRWSEKDQGVSYYELRGRVSDMKAILAEISEWTRYWSPRRLKR